MRVNILVLDAILLCGVGFVVVRSFTNGDTADRSATPIATASSRDEAQFASRFPRAPSEARAMLLQASRLGRTLGPKDANVSIVVFTDLACGHCATMLQGAIHVQEALPDQVNVTVVDFPMSNSRGLLRTHLAARCLGATEEHRALVKAVIANPNQSTMLTGWKAALQRAKIPITEDLRRCVESERDIEVLEAEQKLGTALDIHQTPVSYVNDHRVIGAIPEEDLRRWVAEILRPSPFAPGTE